MPRPGPVRPFVGLTLDPGQPEALDAYATRHGLKGRKEAPNRSEAARRLLAYALLHMPDDWTPEGDHADHRHVHGA